MTLGISKILLIAGGSFAGLAGGSYGVFKFLEKPEGEQNQKNERVDNSGDDIIEEVVEAPKEEDLLWETVSVEGNEQDICQWEIEVKAAGYHEDLEIKRVEKKYVCVTQWYKQIKEQNPNKKGLWIRGRKDKVTEILSEWKDNDLRGESKSYKIESDIKELEVRNKCQIKDENNRVEIVCLEN
ncbi:hypothetical protein [Mycoplasma suis]|uniref:Uncharacterized protein n=1 Tax=Mycoplasma suis (strain Illinois) TaxID=768700 RepID=F0QRR8_MYCSL|nr:hypothetical protein [Mycoplasma suis]ADX98188.1 hypothetical protein MSU_0657 [Mycoplasma suis str. Illinois]